MKVGRGNNLLPELTPEGLPKVDFTNYFTDGLIAGHPYAPCGGSVEARPT